MAMERGVNAGLMFLDSDYVNHSIIVNPSLREKDILYKIIKDAIVREIFMPGEVLYLSQIANYFNTPVAHVKSAVKMLIEAGFVVVDKKSDNGKPLYRVFVMKPKNVKDTFVLRSVLESAAAEVCANSRSEIDFTVLYDYISKFKKALDPKERKMDAICKQCDREFHKYIITSTNNDYLIQSYALIEDRIEYIRRKNRFYYHEADIEMLLRINKQHIAIYNAILSGDSEKAKELSSKHVGFCHKYFNKII